MAKNLCVKCREAAPAGHKAQLVGPQWVGSSVALRPPERGAWASGSLGVLGMRPLGVPSQSLQEGLAVPVVTLGSRRGITRVVGKGLATPLPVEGSFWAQNRCCALLRGQEKTASPPTAG